MHTVIYALVEASSQREALSNGKLVFDRLVYAGPNADSVFDYYTTFDGEGPLVSEAKQENDHPPAAPIDSPAGEELLTRAWEETKAEFSKNLGRAKEVLDNLSEEEIMRNEQSARLPFRRIGSFEGPAVFLYDEVATGIRHRKQLDRLLEERENLWIVPGDVHY